MRYNGNSTSCCLPVWPLYLGFSTAIVTISSTRDPFMKERKKKKIVFWNQEIWLLDWIADVGFFFFDQVRYAAQDIPAAKSARARGSYLRVSFKNTRETAQAINGMKLQRALTFLDNVKNKAEVVPFRRFASSTGRNAQSELPYPPSSYDIRQEVVSG